MGGLDHNRALDTVPYPYYQEGRMLMGTLLTNQEVYDLWEEWLKKRDSLFQDWCNFVKHTGRPDLATHGHFHCLVVDPDGVSPEEDGA
jgi:hypothetical protein